MRSMVEGFIVKLEKESPSHATRDSPPPQSRRSATR